MRKDWKYILYIALAFGLFLVLKLISPKQHNWTITYAADDKNPYGGFAFDHLIRTDFSKTGVRQSFKTLYELKDSLKPSDNIVIIASTFTCGKEDTEVLLNHVAAGGNAFISANYFYGTFPDTLKLYARDDLFISGLGNNTKDSINLKFSTVSFDTTQAFRYRHDNVHNYFGTFDSTRTTAIARNGRQAPVTVRVKWGKGNFILNSTPMIFTNIYLLADNNHEFASSTLSAIPNTSFYRTEYYHRGRMEIQTPLRFILQNEPLRWAYYITFISILVFMIFEMKRRQRIIPVIKPLANTTLEFVNTIGTLYFQDAHHKGIAEKKINYFFDMVRTRYLLSTNVLDENFILSLARKAGKPDADIRTLINLMQSIRSAPNISEQTLIELNDRIEDFHSTTNITHVNQ